METETLHPEFIRLCNAYSNEIWVPSSHNKRIFTESGVKKPIYVMPLGIDETLYKPNDINELGIINDPNVFVDLLGRQHTDGINSFRFLTLFGWSYRKGTDVLIKSFVEEFTNDDDVALIICARHSGSPAEPHRNVIRSEVMRYANSVRSNKHPQILLYPHIIPEKQMPSIYRMGHAFVHYSRGEGFSLTQIEASACNLPVISCNNTGMSEYLTDQNAYLVKTNEKEICSPEMHWISGFYHNQLFPKLGRDQIDQAKRHMRFVINNYEKAKEKAKIFKSEVFEKYTWSKVAERVAYRIKSIYREN
jgi:glycosyltransferase involved in cell wall biosynthesis